MNISQIKLVEGNSDQPNRMCVMQLVSIIAMEKRTDTPKCTDWYVLNFCMQFNDSIGDRTRRRLKGYVHKLVGCRGYRRHSKKAHDLIEARHRKVFRSNGRANVEEGFRLLDDLIALFPKHEEEEQLRRLQETPDLECVTA